MLDGNSYHPALVAGTILIIVFFIYENGTSYHPNSTGYFFDNKNSHPK